MKNIINPFKQLYASRRRLSRKVRWEVKRLMAYLWRRALDKRTTFVGITGSAGKTTTADLIAAVLAVQGPCHKTNAFNSDLAIVQAVLATRFRHRSCVAELGVSVPGSLDRPIRAFRPHIAVITVIGRDHIGSFPDQEGIAAEKEKVVTALQPDGVAVLNIDDPLVRAIGERCGRKVVWFGSAEGADLRLVEAHSRWPEPLTLRIAYAGAVCEVRTQLHGTHMAVPVLAALGTAVAMGVPLARAAVAVASVHARVGRMQAVDGGDDVWFIRDDWKAPEWSFPIALEFLKAADARRKIAIIGTISDITGNSTREYRKFCRKAREVADLVVFVGSHAHRGLRARSEEDDETIQGFSSIRQAAAFLQRELQEGDLVLLKGSCKSDHLVRLLLNRASPVQCWRDHCEKLISCEHCPQLHVPQPEEKD